MGYLWKMVYRVRDQSFEDFTRPIKQLKIFLLAEMTLQQIKQISIF